MYFDDHDPPHFHAAYGGREARIAIQPIDVLTTDLPPRALSMVLEWAAWEQRGLLENWSRLRSGLARRRLDPLE